MAADVVRRDGEGRGIKSYRIVHAPMIAAVTSEDLPEEFGREVVAVGRSGRTAVLQLVVRTGIIRILSLVGTAILARILLPEDFGTFAVVTFLVNLVGPLADFGLAPALIQQDERPTQRQMSTVFLLQIGIASAFAGVVWVVAPLAHFIAPGLPADFDWMVRLAAVVLPLIAIRATPSAMMSRVLRFGPLAVIEVVQVGAYFATAVVLALNGAGAWSFIWALVVHTLVGAVLAHLAWRGRLTFEFSWQDARRIIGFGLPFQATGLLVSAREALVPVFGGLAGGLAGIGYLNFGFRLGRLAGSVDEVIGRVAFPVFSRLQGDVARLNRALSRTLEATALMVAVLLSWAIAVAPTLVPLVFSERWRPAVEVFQLVAAATFALVPASFVRGLAFATGAGRMMFWWSAVTIGFLVVTFPLSLIWFGVVGGGVAFAVYSVLQLACYVYATRRTISFPWAHMMRIYAIALAGAVASALVNSALGGVTGLLVSGLAFVLVFGVLLLLFERDPVDAAWRMLRGDMAFRETDEGQSTDEA